MRRALKFLFLIVISAVGVLYQLAQLGLRLNNTLRLVEDSAAFQVLQSRAPLDILITGDSTGVGTGAALPSASVAGLIAQHHPCASIVNRARDGAMAKDVTAQIDGTGDSHFNLALVQIGTQDILRFTDLGELKHAITETLNRATTRADRVILMGARNLGAAPMFLPPLDWVYDRRARSAAGICCGSRRRGRPLCGFF
jgi:hypothetical protein